MRDTQKDEQYFQDYLAEKSNDIHAHLIEIRRAELSGESPHELTLYRHFRLEMERFHASFSIENPVDVLREHYTSLLVAAEKLDTLEYDDTLNLLAIGILLDLNPLPQIEDFVDEHQDDFLGLFTGHLKGEEEFGFPPDIEYPYILLYLNIALTESTTESEQILYDYLTMDWYESKNEEYWYDYLRYENLYFGYWCFEAMALAKMYGVTNTTRLEQTGFFALL